MSIDIAQMRSNIRNATGTDDVDLPDSDVDLYLNEGYWELLDKFPFREKEVSTTFSTIAGTRVYGVPSPFEALRHIAIRDPNTNKDIPLDKMTADFYEQNYDTDTDAQAMPTRYLRESCAVKLWPTPDDIYIITLRYWTVLADLSDGTPTSDLPQAWHEIIKLGGLWRAYLYKNNDHLRARSAKAFQSELLNSMVPTEAKEEYDTHRAGVQVILNDYDV